MMITEEWNDKPAGRQRKTIAQDRADWLLDAVACATQDRRFLRGDPAYDAVAGEAILLNGNKAINVALAATNARIRAICEDGERSGADRLDEIYRIVKGEG